MSAAPQSQQAEPASYQEELQRSGLSKVQLNPKDQFGEDLPVYASGLSAVTPINSSPLSVGERFKLALGDEKGNADWLKSKFKQVVQNKNGDYTVLDADGRWKRIDPEGNNGDPWELTKDIADMAPTAGKIGASIVAGVLSGGTSLAAQAGVMAGVGAAGSLAQTSMGRAFGTYSDDPVAQVKDMALETVLNAGGVFIPVAAKYGKEALGGLLNKSFTALGKAAPEVQNTISGILSTFTGASDDVIRTTFESTDEVTNSLNGALKGRTSDQARDYLKTSMFAPVKGMLENMTAGVSNMYEQMAKRVAAVVPEDKVFTGLDVMQKRFQDVLVKNGIGAVNEAGEFALKTTQQVWDDLALPTGKMAEGLGLNKDEMLALLYKINQNMGAMSNASLLKGKEGFLKLVSIDKEIKLIQRQLAGIAQTTNNSGLIGLTKSIGNITDDIMRPNYDMGTFIDMRKLWGNDVVEQLGKLTSTTGERIIDATGRTRNPLQALNHFYDMAEDAISPLRMATAQGQNVSAVESVMNSLSSASKTRVAPRNNFDAVVGLLNSAKVYNSNLHNIAANVSKTAQQLRVNNAASTWTQWARPGLISTQAGVAAATGVGAAMATDNEKAIPWALAAGGAITSPRLAYTAIKGMMAGRQFISQLAAKGGKEAFIKEAAKNPGLATEFGLNLVNGPRAYSGTLQGLVDDASAAVFNKPTGGPSTIDMLQRRIMQGPDAAPPTNPFKR